jgi:hypothetical protein
MKMRTDDGVKRSRATLKDWTMPKPYRSPFPPLELDLDLSIDDEEVSTCRPRLQSTPDSTLRPTSRKAELAQLLADEDFATGLVVADEMLAADGADRDAKEAKTRCLQELERIYECRLGSLAQIPVLAVTMKELPNLAIDNRSAFIVSLVDGISTLDMVLDMSGMPRLEALRVLYELTKNGIVTMS